MNEESAITSWNDCDIYKVRDQRQPIQVDEIEANKFRSEIEPWLTALFQSEHLSLLLGGGMSSALHWMAKNEAGAGMAQIPFSVFNDQIKKRPEKVLKKQVGANPILRIK